MAAVTTLAPVALAHTSRNDLVMTGRATSTIGDTFTIGDSKYADDTGLPFTSRQDVDEQTPKLLVHFEAWGMEIHAGIYAPNGSVAKESKTEVLFCSARLYANPATYDGTDLSDVQLPGGCFMPIVDKFMYLGRFVTRDGDDAVDVDSRIEKAGKAFGALRGCLFASTHINMRAKRAAYMTLILNVLLYGAETWSTSERMLQRLRVFHARCVRAMCRVSRKHTWDHHLSTAELERRLGLDSIDVYLARRQLRWLGHVRRMDYEQRLPRRMLSAWVARPRPCGAPPMTYGRSIGRALDEFHIDRRTWHELAADREAWRETLRLGHPPGFVAAPPTPPLALTRPTRRAAIAANCGIDDSLRALRAPLDATDGRRLATADRRRLVALDGERVHPHPGMMSATQAVGPRTVDRSTAVEAERVAAAAVEAERLRLAAKKARLMQRQREQLAAKRQQLRATEAALRAAAASDAPP